MSALDWTAWLLGWSLLLQTLELWRLRAQLQERFPWSIVGRDQRWLDPLLNDPTWLLVLQAVVALALNLAWWMPWLALLLALLQATRFRGNFNGGSDAMTLVVLVGLALARSWRPEVGLGYIAAQLVLSYFLAGVYKLGARDWRDGSALPSLLRAPQYRASLKMQPGLARWAGYGLIAFECAFPLALFDRHVALVAMALGLCFHVLNALVLGLNRFLWAWLAAYPALWYWTQP